MSAIQLPSILNCTDLAKGPRKIKQKTLHHNGKTQRKNISSANYNQDKKIVNKNKY
jgi:hypothetical protein